MGVTPTLALTIAVATIGGSFQFYNYGVVNNAQTNLQSWINETFAGRYPLDGGLSTSNLTLLWSFLVSMFCIGGLFGSLITTSLAENCGRRNGLIATGFISLLATGLEAGAKVAGSPELLIVGRFITGVSAGINCGLVPLYLTEIAPVHLRGAVGTCHQIVIAFGDWFGFCLSLPNVLGSNQLWPFAICFSMIPAALLCLLLPCSPESSRYLLISRKDPVGSRKNMEVLLGRDESEAAFDDLLREASQIQQEKKKKEKVKLITMFRKRELLIPTLISIMGMVGQQFTGIAAIFAYSSDIFLQANLSLMNAKYCTMGIGIAYFLCTLPSPFLIERQGRRLLCLAQLSGCLTALILLSVFVGLSTDYNQKWASYASIGALLLFMCSYGLGSPIPWLIASELFGQEYRSMAVSIGTFTSFGCAFLVSLSYLPFQRAVGPALSFLPFIIITIGVIIIMAIFLPETKNKNIEEILSEFQTRQRRLSRKMTTGRVTPTMDEVPPPDTHSEERRRLLSDAKKSGFLKTSPNTSSSGDFSDTKTPGDTALYGSMTENEI